MYWPWGACDVCDGCLDWVLVKVEWPFGESTRFVETMAAFNSFWAYSTYHHCPAFDKEVYINTVLS